MLCFCRNRQDIFTQLLNLISINKYYVLICKRTNNYYKFCYAKKGVLICTDVATSCLDISEVDWIIQYDPPDYRVERTQKRFNSPKKELIFLFPEEKEYLIKLNFLQKNQLIFRIKLKNQQKKITIQITVHFEAYRSFLLSYQSQILNDVYDVNNLDLAQVSISFGFKCPPQFLQKLWLAQNKENKMCNLQKQETT